MEIHSIIDEIVETIINRAKTDPSAHPLLSRVRHGELTTDDLANIIELAQRPPRRAKRRS